MEKEKIARKDERDKIIINYKEHLKKFIDNELNCNTPPDLKIFDENETNIYNTQINNIHNYSNNIIVVITGLNSRFYDVETLKKYFQTYNLSYLDQDIYLKNKLYEKLCQSIDIVYNCYQHFSYIPKNVNVNIVEFMDKKYDIFKLKETDKLQDRIRKIEILKLLKINIEKCIEFRELYITFGCSLIGEKIIAGHLQFNQRLKEIIDNINIKIYDLEQKNIKNKQKQKNKENEENKITLKQIYKLLEIQNKEELIKILKNTIEEEKTCQENLKICNENLVQEKAKKVNKKIVIEEEKKEDEEISENKTKKSKVSNKEENITENEDMIENLLGSYSAAKLITLCKNTSISGYSGKNKENLVKYVKTELKRKGITSKEKIKELINTPEKKEENKPEDKKSNDCKLPGRSVESCKSNAFKKEVLQEMAVKCGLAKSGTKEEICKRIQSHLDDN
jgi:hypothetical protein